MTDRRIIIVIFCLSLGISRIKDGSILNPYTPAGVVTFVDKNFESFIRELIDKPQGIILLLYSEPTWSKIQILFKWYLFGLSFSLAK